CGVSRYSAASNRVVLMAMMLHLTCFASVLAIPQLAYPACKLPCLPDFEHRITVSQWIQLGNQNLMKPAQERLKKADRSIF
ncbi:MAG: hypothetical protein ACRESV_07935, partial [Nevskiales bacterium]